MITIKPNTYQQPITTMKKIIFFTLISLCLFSCAQNNKTTTSKFGLSQEQIEKAQEDAISIASDQLAQYLILKYEWQYLSTTQEKNKWIADNKKQFDELGISINSVVDAENILVKNTHTFINALRNKSLADAYKSLMKDITAKYLKALSDSKNFNTNTTWDELKNSYPEIWSMLQKDTRGIIDGVFENRGRRLGGYIYTLTEYGLQRVQQAIENYHQTNIKNLELAIQDLETSYQGLLKTTTTTNTTSNFKLK